MATAGAGLLPDPPTDVGNSFIIPTAIGNAVTSYNSVSIIGNLQAIWNSAEDLVLANSMTYSTLFELTRLGSNTFPAVTGTIPIPYNPSDLIVPGLVTPWDQSVPYAIDDQVSYQNNIYIATAKSQNIIPTNVSYWKLYLKCYSIANIISLDASTIMGSGDQSKFCSTFMSAQGYLSQANETINSVKNSDVLAVTFSPATGGMDNLTTGGLNQVSNNIKQLAQDFKKLGKLFDLSRLQYLGLPGELLAQIGRVSNGLAPSISQLLLNAGITNQQIANFALGENILDATAEKNAYNVMLKITGNDLDQVKTILGVTTSGITNMAQLLNPTAIMPTSYSTLLCPTSAGLQLIYVTGGGVTSANQNLIPTVENVGVQTYTGSSGTNSYSTLKLIIPADQALANKAFAQALQQIKSITATNLPELSTAMLTIESNAGLSAVNNLLVPIPSTVLTSYQQQLGQGSGPNGTLVLDDIIGMAYDPIFANSISSIANSVSKLNVTSLNAVYVNMSDTLAGTYGPPTGPIDITSGPGVGVYTDIDSAFTTGLIPVARTAIANIATANPSSVSLTKTSYTSIINELVREIANQNKAQLNFGDLPNNSTTTTMAFASNLHEYGLDPGASAVLTKLSNPATLAGQCIVSSLREGRNIAALQKASIALDTQLSDAPTPNSPAPVKGVSWTRTSQNWSKAATLTNLDRNWGLLRSYRGSQIANWGFDGVGNQPGTVSVNASGTNVDVVIVDAVIDPYHPEFAVNPDGSGGSRVKYYNWYAANIPGDPTSGQSYNPPIYTGAASSSDDSRHACHVAGTVAGNTQGWAPNANIYNISPQYVNGGVPYLYLYPYILAWHLKKRSQGNMNPTICNNSWSSRYTIPYTSITSVTYRGVVHAGPFTTADLLNYGITNNGSGYCIVSLQNSTMNSQIQECINAGIIMVAAAANNDTRLSVSGDADYNNTLTATGFNGGSPIYYTRPSSPIYSNVISVGAIGPGITDRKLSYSNCGPGVNLFGPGAYVTSAWLTNTPPSGGGYPTPVPDPRNFAYYMAKDSGTSMASPQVTGILACQLEINPTMTQSEALTYITSASIAGQIPDSGGGYSDVYSLQGAPNRYLTLPPTLKPTVA